MGIVICSKYKIDYYKTYKLDNPNLIYFEDKNTTRYSHDKGFIFACINHYNIITGHCLPFQVFKKNLLEYLYIFKKADEEFMNFYNSNDKLILCGDFNYEDIQSLFPKIMKNCVDLIDCPTNKDKQLDHFVISNKLKCSYKSINDNIFDHKLGIFEIYD